MPLTFKSIELQNFMCHRHFKIDFTKRVTFIGGLNGSGKSAIMISLGLLLGERAKNLERGNSFKDLIKTNSSECKISLILSNTVNFHFEFFGDEIIIERRINEKSNSLFIMNKFKKVWSKKKEDLDVLLNHFSISFRNPLNFLTQEHAKKFLNISKPSVLYEFFMKGTELEINKTLHKEAEEEVLEMNERIEEIKKRNEVVENELLKRKNKIEVISNIKNWQKTLERIEVEKKWAQVDFNAEKKIELELVDLNVKLNNEQNELIVYVNQIQHEKQKMNKEIDEIRKRNLERQEKENELNGKITEKELNKREIENDLKEIEENINKQKKDLEDFKLSMNEERIKFLDESLVKNKIKIEDLHEEKIMLENQKNCIEEKSIKEEERISNTKIQINQIQRMIEENKKIKINNLVFFGDRMPDLVNAIKNTKFSGMVIGPLSNEVSLKEKKWYKPVSFVLNNYLNSFIVFEQDDKKKILNLLQNLNIKNVSIYMPSNKNNELIRFRKNQNFKSVLDVIECSNNKVLNQLIILAQIESIILIEERSLAHKIIKSKPNDVDIAFTINGDQIKMFNNNLSDFAYSGPEKFFFQNSADKIIDLETNLNELKNKNLKNEFLDNIYSLKRKINDTEVLIEKIGNETRNFEFELRTLKNVKAKIHEKDIENINEELEINLQQFDELKCLLKEINMEILEKRNEFDKLKLKYSSNEENYRKELKSLEEKQNMAKYKINFTKEIILKKVGELNTISDSINLQKINLIKLGHEFDKIREEKIIDDEIFELKAKIQLHDEKIDEIDMQNVIHELESEKENNENLLDEFEKKVLKIKINLERRNQRREEIKQKESKRATKDFKFYMELRDYDGNLIFDHEKELLEIKVKLKNNKIAGDKNTLSGGEKSYAGICLLLSLWPSVCCPVKILDEFDVYMDNLNRKSAIESILEYFKDESSQLILITPLDTFNLKNDHCDVFVMQPPEKKKSIK
ncbi:Structural maintenance of chromosomes protein 6 [Gurleya vavrai]